MRLPTTSLLSLLCLALLLAACAKVADPSLQKDIEQEKLHGFIDELTAQNNALRMQNDELQASITEQEAFIEDQNTSLQQCEERLFLWETRHGNVPSPADWVPLEQVQVYEDRVVLNISGALPVRLSDTKSMDPLADSNATMLVIRPTRARDITVGDIIGYRCTTCAEGVVVMHRVIEISQDVDGIYYIVKGDNAPLPDPDRVRFSQVETVVVGVIY